MSSEVSRRYSEALFELAKERSTIEQIKNECKLVEEVFKENPILDDFFRAVKISKDEKKEMISSLFTKESDDLRHFMMLLVDKDRMYYVHEMMMDVIALCNEALGIETATVVSARPLAKEQLERIRQALIQKTKKTIVMENKVDPTLIAGIKVIIGSNVTDVSMAHSLDNLKQMLLSKGDIL